MYYLQSRYYNPELGRFISADDPAYLGADGSIPSYNLFAYCNNNPVSYCDPSGHGPITAFVLTAVLYGLLSAGANVAGQMFFEQRTLETIDWRDVTISGISGFCSALIPGSGFVSLAGQAVASSFVENGLRAIWLGEDFEIAYVIQDSIVSLGTGYAMKGISHLSQKFTSKIFNKAPNFSQYQHYFRSKGYDYSRQEVYQHIKKYMNYQHVTDYVVDCFLEFTFSFLTYPL